MLDFSIDRPIQLYDSVTSAPSDTGIISTLWKSADANPIVPDTQPTEYTIDRFVMDKTKDSNPVSLGGGTWIADHGFEGDAGVPDTVEQNPVLPTDARDSAIPTILGLKTTDKNRIDYGTEGDIGSRGVTPPIDATLLNNPVVDNLQNFRTDNYTSPLGANFAENRSVVGSGQDSVGFYTNGISDAVTTTQPETVTAPADQSTSQSWFDWLTTTAGGKSIKGEVTILLVGIVILAIGIFALTR